jgi:DeoR/GlpR family transcriptional regulator of sugar metabolism
MESMNLPDERRARIIEILNDEGKVTPPVLSERFGVSVDTIRRDLIHLENAGQLTKVHGGALPRSPATAPYLARKSQNSAAKTGIAKRTARLIQPGQVIFMDSGTTVEETARQLPADLTATVVTASLPVATALAGHERIKVVMPGGTLDTASMTLRGSAMLGELSRVRADVCVLGVCSIDPDAGITCTDFDEAPIKQRLIENARKVIVPVTSDKLGTAASFAIGDVDCVDLIIVEKSVPAEALAPYEKLNVQLVRGV